MRLELRLEGRVDQAQGGTRHQNLADAPGLSTEAAQAPDEASHMFPWACQHIFYGRYLCGNQNFTARSRRSIAWLISTQARTSHASSAAMIRAQSPR